MKGTTVFFDLETGGVEERHPTIQVAAAAVRKWKVVETFERKIRFNVDACDPEALRLNGYVPIAWSASIPEAQAMREFDAFCNAHADLRLVSKRTGRPYTVARLAGHNVVTFDVPRVRAGMDRAGVAFWKACWWYPLDTYQRALWHYTENGLALPEDFTLQGLAKSLGLPAQGAEHEALADVLLCVRLAEALCEAGREVRR